jgi:hypothetical protein
MLHEEKKVEKMNEVVIRLTNIKNGRLIKEKSLINKSDRKLKNACKNYENGAFSVSFPIFKKYSEDDNAIANYYLARSYYFGQGVSQNYIMAINYLNKNKGYSLIDAHSLFFLSRCYRYGRGVAVNIEKADSLVFEAACMGLFDAIELLQIEKDMSRNDVLDWIITVLDARIDLFRQRKKALEERLIKDMPKSVPKFELSSTEPRLFNLACESAIRFDICSYNFVKFAFQGKCLGICQVCMDKYTISPPEHEDIRGLFV